ncbi:Shedu immune nuclease family protein [Mucilaginibacter angelicae]|uniref:Shedu immune nuclease family protein n=1 Tax=Mucilaginibacter angelicae TaxID=869718 RepID=A0ABV6KZU9_9SPHI
MITFTRHDDFISLNYTVEYGESDWVSRELKKSGYIRLKKTFLLEEQNFITQSQDDEEEDEIFDPEIYKFRFANLSDGYFEVIPGIISRTVRILFEANIDLDISYFVADVTTSIFRLLERLVEEPIYIGGDVPTAIPISEFEKMIEGFPTAHEKKLYAEARMSAILKNYLDKTKDSEMQYQRYMNKKISRQGANLQKTFKETELVKYQTLLEKVEGMLSDEKDYSEKQWQVEILEIIQLLYPKYIAVLSNVPISDKTISDRILDFLLIDTNGHVDIIEIKKPFDNSIITSGKHRNNYIPLRELSGTIMQLEKYIYFLNRWSADGEKYLLEKYRDLLPDDIEIRITNPNGIIIMGRENNLNTEQRLDFEVVKRKYKNVMDIITYDSLIYRLKKIIEQIQKK